MNEISFIMAFTAGVVSFLSPCVLPLFPGYLSFISGVSIDEIQKGEQNLLPGGKQYTILLNALFFIIGFSAVFVVLGASATWIGTFLTLKMSLFTKLAGLLIIFFGLLKLGLIRWLFFYREIKFNIKANRFGVLGSFLLGASFAFGWTPCIGPILAGILTYAGTLGQVDKGIWLLLVYSLGLGLPFFLSAIGIKHFFRFFNRIKKHLGLIEKISGAILVIMGILIFTNSLVLIQAYLPFLNKFAL